MIPLADIFIALKWLLALYLCSFVGVFLLINSGQFNKIRYLLGKALGVIGIAAITWLLSIFSLLPFTFWTILGVLSASYLIVIALRFNKIIESFKTYWKTYLLIEVVFISLFVVGVVIRSSIPKIEGIEKFMDSAILSNLLRHKEGVPVDTWYAPDALNYYYFGHWIVATIAKLCSASIDYAFNLGFVTFLAIAGSNIFGLGWQLSKKIVGGFLTLFFALFAANLHPFISVISGSHNYFFFNSGRFVEQVINEYPFYSVVLGDLHAHMLSLIITTSIYLALFLVFIESNLGSKLVFTLITGLLTGLAAATNSFDVFTSFILFGLVVTWLTWKKHLIFKDIIILGTAFIVSFLIILGIFLTNFKAAVSGIAFAHFPIPPLHVFWQFGAFLILIALSLYVLSSNNFKNNRLQVAYTLILVAAGLVLVLVPEFILFKDIYYYENLSFASANTVFKMWYAAWPLLATSAAVLSIYAYKNSKFRRTIAIVLILVCSAILVGTYTGLKTLKDSQPNTLSGLSYLKQDNPKKLEVIKWANNNIEGQPIVLQAIAESYTTGSWFSSYTGTSSVLGWRSHEWGWRYSVDEWNKIEQRSQNIQQVYEAKDTKQLRRAVSDLRLSYVLIGPDEESFYKVNPSLFTQTFGIPVFQNNLYKIYKL